MAEAHPSRRQATHLNIGDREEREEFAARMGIDEGRLRKAVRMVGSRITTLSSYLKA